MFSYEDRLKRAEQHAKRVAEQKVIQEARHKNDSPKKLTTTKLVMIYLFLLMNIILFFAMGSMIYLQDLSALPVLITDIAAQVLIYLGYLVKSLKENTVNGIIFEAAMHEIETNLGKGSDEGDAVG